ncbi:hypothetical protein Rxycam_00850 [Rubrobacter xylanophilus DSM 9941]|nr:hypothetical protein Rxycam_00850 [Rubrobacter xylanophilus DSM 9941]
MGKEGGQRGGRGRLRGGCLGVLLELAFWVGSTVLISVGAFLLLFGLLRSDPPPEPETVAAILAVPVGAYAFLRVGRSILRDLRGDRAG